MSLKNIFITGSLSLLLGFYSIYNLIQYLKTIEKTMKEQNNNLRNEIMQNNKKYMILHLKMNALDTKYNAIFYTLEQLKENLNKMETDKEQDLKQDVKSESRDDIISETSFYTKGSIICDDLCDFNIDIPRPKIQMETSNAINNDDILSNVVDDHFSEENVSRKTNKTDEIRSRSNSISDISWTGITKKFIFGQIL